MYFDYNATAPLRPQARHAMTDAMDLVGNPTSVHAYGRKVRSCIENTRTLLGDVFGVASKNVIFTSGATEANNMVIQQHRGPVLVSAIEHDSVFTVRDDVHVIKVTHEGIIDLSHLEILLKKQENEGTPPALVCVLAAHNETGIIQPIEEIMTLCKEYGAMVHIDAVQSFTKTKQAYKGATSIAISAHKIGGPSGVGALIKSEKFHPKALIRGGGQERSFRSGTENFLGITGFGAAVQDALTDDHVSIQKRRDSFERELCAFLSDVTIFGKKGERLSNTSNFAMPGKKSEILLMHFDQKNIAVSSGAACSSGKVKISRSLKAMGISEDLAKGALRISIGTETTDHEVACLIQACKDIFAPSTFNNTLSKSQSHEDPCQAVA